MADCFDVNKSITLREGFCHETSTCFRSARRADSPATSLLGTHMADGTPRTPDVVFCIWSQSFAAVSGCPSSMYALAVSCRCFTRISYSLCNSACRCSNVATELGVATRGKLSILTDVCSEVMVTLATAAPVRKRTNAPLMTRTHLSSACFRGSGCAPCA